MDVKLSIIVPIYNTGPYLHKCIKSLLEQTLKGIEIILVDDGSKDNSGLICDEYAKKYSCIKVIHKVNEGVSIARNTGIKAACGEYIGFLDSDDWVERSMFQGMISKAERYQVDVVLCDAITVYGDLKKEIDTILLLPNSCLIAKSEMTPQLLLQLAGSVWRCIYRKGLLIEHSIEFPIALKFSEDRIFNIIAFGRSRAIYYCKHIGYNRFMREGSAVNRYYSNMLDIVLDARQHIIDAIDLAWGGREDIKNIYEQQTICLAMSTVYNEFHKDCKNGFKVRLNNVRYICNNDTVQKAFEITGVHGLRNYLLHQKQALLLCLVAKIFNLKNRR